MATSKKLFTPHVLLALSRYDYRTHRGIARFAAKNNWHLNCEMAITGKLPKDWQGDGIVTMLSDNEELIKLVTTANVPFVDLSIMRDDIKAHRVIADNHSIGRLAGEYFIVRGYRHFAFFSTTNENVANVRRDIFFDTIKHRAISILDWGLKNTESHWEDKKAILTRHLLQAPLPIAIFTARDLDASITLDACLQANLKVPEDVAILGVDNNDLITESLQVPLSSVNHDVERLGYEGAQLLHRLMLGESVSDNIQLILPTGITTRKSTDYLAVSDKLVEKTLNFIAVNFNNAKLTIDKIVEQINISRRSLDKKFKLELGHSIHTELNNMRLRAATKALIETQTAVVTIAEQCGFNTAQYFNLIFREHTQLTPLAYRKKFQKNFQ